MHLFDRLDEHQRRRPFRPIRIHDSSGSSWLVVAPECLTCDKVDSILHLLVRDRQGDWMDILIRGSQVAAVEIPSLLIEDEDAADSEGSRS